MTRLFFEAVADECTRHLFTFLDSMRPAALPSGAAGSSVAAAPRGGTILDALTPLPTYPATFRSSQSGATAVPLTLEGLLKSCEHTGYREASQPAGLLLQLKPLRRRLKRKLLPKRKPKKKLPLRKRSEKKISGKKILGLLVSGEYSRELTS